MRKLIISALTVAVLTAAACSSRPSRTIHDTAFVRQANALCKEQLPSLRAQKEQSDIFGRTSKNDRSKTADKVEKAADGLDKLASDLSGVPVRRQDQGEVASWLEEWANYTGIGRRYAAALRTQRDSVITRISKEANMPVHNIAYFARANRIDNCVL